MQNWEALFNHFLVLNALLFTGNALLMWLTVVAFLHVLLLNFFTGVTLTALAIARMDQIDELLRTGRHRSRRIGFRISSPADVAILHSIIVTNLFYICRANTRFYGPIFLVFIVVNVPISLRLLIWTLFTDGSSPSLGFLHRFAMLIFVLSEMIGIFGVHFMLTLYSKRIHRPAKVALFSHLVRADDSQFNEVENFSKNSKESSKGSRRTVTTRNRFKFAWLIAVLHTSRQFGITYGPCGLVTLNTFARFVALFGKFLLITYKRHHL